MATGTYAPAVPQQYFDNSGNPLAAGTIETFAAGTSNHLATYSDVALTVPNGNPMTLDGSGRPPAGQIFLTPGQSYKFLIKDSGGNTIATPDNIQAVPSSSSNVDDTGTAGEALTAGQVVYLSDGSGGKVSGQWYKADSTNPYSSTIPLIGMVPNNITSGSSGTIRLNGSVSAGSYTVGADYYVSTGGSVTSTPPSNNRRYIGRADSTTSIIFEGNPSVAPFNISECNGRLTLTSGTPITTADVTAATTLYFTPYKGNRCALYDGTNWSVRTFAELSIAVPNTASQMYDVWLFDNSGTLALELLAWTNDTTRATALTMQDGVYVKSGATTRRYLGSFRTTAVSGQTEDSAAKRFVWNYYNRVQRLMRVTESTSSWTWATASFHQANASTANQIALAVGVAEVTVDVAVVATGLNTGTTNIAVGIGENSTTAAVAGSTMSPGFTVGGSLTAFSARARRYPAVGYTYYAWLEYGAVNTTFYGTDGVSYIQSGIDGVVWG